MIGTVYLVGAGPGDPRLLTLRGAEVLRTADAVVYDRLVSPSLLELAPDRSHRIDVGKEPGRPHPDQAEINCLLVDLALAGKDVVRLKGGDPFVFGRGGEEALACARAGVPFEIVPGVTSATAAPAYAGIPVTHRGLARSFAVVTATRADGGDVDLRRIGAAVDTLVVLMAAARLERTCASLIEAGRAPDDPAALVEWAATPSQRVVTATLAGLPSRARAAGLRPPVTLVVGPVAALADELAWFGENSASDSSADLG